MNENEYNDSNLDFLIKKAVMSLTEKESDLFDRLEKDTSIINPNQDEFDKKIYSLINKHFNTIDSRLIKQRMLKKFIFKVATFILILLSGFIIPFITVDAFREKVVNFYIEHFNTHASFVPKDGKDIFTTFIVGYIPEGYVESDEFKAETLYSITFLNQKNNILDITLYNNNTSYNIDIENSEKYNVNIKNKNSYIYRKTGSISLIFKFHGNSIVISSNDDNLSNEELIKIAESIN